MTEREKETERAPPRGFWCPVHPWLQLTHASPQHGHTRAQHSQGVLWIWTQNLPRWVKLTVSCFTFCAIIWFIFFCLKHPAREEWGKKKEETLRSCSLLHPALNIFCWSKSKLGPLQVVPNMLRTSSPLVLRSWTVLNCFSFLYHWTMASGKPGPASYYCDWKIIITIAGNVSWVFLYVTL